MTNAPLPESPDQEEDQRLVERRAFLRSLGKWSAVAIGALVGGAWLASAPQAQAGAWINRRGYGGGGWINGRRYYGGGGGWINGGGWVNRRYYGGGGSWINRY